MQYQVSQSLVIITRLIIRLSFSGLDYVSHLDIIPYQTFESTALSHELFDKFLTRTDTDPPGFSALETLKAWQKKNHTFLELSDVHIETTNSIRVTVIPFYMGCRETPSSSVYWVSENVQQPVVTIS